MAAAITLDVGVAEEVVQDAFVGLQRNAAGVTQPLGYLQRSVVNASIKVLRRRRLAATRIPPPLLVITDPGVC